MITKQDILNLTKEEEEKPIFSKHAIKMKFSPFENVPSGLRRCGECGTVFTLIEFKKKKGYDWKCKDCNKYLGVYNE